MTPAFLSAFDRVVDERLDGHLSHAPGAAPLRAIQCQGAGARPDRVVIGKPDTVHDRGSDRVSWEGQDCIFGRDAEQRNRLELFPSRSTDDQDPEHA